MSRGGGRPQPGDFDVRFGRRLRAVRERQRLTRQAVELLTWGRFNASNLRAYELGTRALSVERAAELAAFYGIPLADLISVDDGPLRDGAV